MAKSFKHLLRKLTKSSKHITQENNIKPNVQENNTKDILQDYSTKDIVQIPVATVMKESPATIDLNLLTEALAMSNCEYEKACLALRQLENLQDCTLVNAAEMRLQKARYHRDYVYNQLKDILSENPEKCL